MPQFQLIVLSNKNELIPSSGSVWIINVFIHEFKIKY